MPVCLECIRKAPIRRCAFVWNSDFLIFFTGADVRACVRVCLTFDECLRYTRSHPHPRAGDYSYVTLQLYLHDVPVENGGATTFYPNTGEDFYRSPSRYANRPFRIAVMAIIISIFTTYHHHMPSIIVSHLLLYCFIRPFFYFLYSFFFFFFSREGRSLFYADWCTRWWMTFHFTKPRHSPIPCQPKAGSVLIFTQDLPHEGSMLQAGIKYTMRTEAMYVWELCDGKQTYIFFFFFLWLLTSALTWHSFSGIPQSTTVGPATIEPRFFDIFLTTHTRFHTQFSSLIVLR